MGRFAFVWLKVLKLLVVGRARRRGCCTGGGNVVIERGKPLLSPSPRAKISSEKSPTFNRRTIVY